VEKVGAEVEVLADVDEHPVMVRQGKILATSFHPELTGDGRIHRMLLDLI
jgi:5'-phosphate synthase pdxT subunit